MQRKVENVKISTILILILCSLNLYSSSQELPDAEYFINRYFLKKMNLDSVSGYWVYKKTLTQIDTGQISIEVLKNNEQRKINIENPNEYYRRFPIEEILNADDLNFIKNQLKRLDARDWDNTKFIKNISLLKSNKDIEKVSFKLLKNKRFANKVKCVYEFSLPVFSKDKSVAMVFVNTYCSKAQGGDIIFYQKDDEKWEIKCFYNRWISLYD